MASIGRDPNGRKRILFVAPDGSRKTIRLGKCDIKQADAFRIKLESLLAARITGSMDAELARWVRSLPDEVHEKFASVGLVESKAHANATLASLLAMFFKSLTVKDSTRTTYEQAGASLEKHFGKSAQLTSIGPLRAEEFAQALRASSIAPATTSKRIKTARRIFKSAVRWKMILENPFADVRAGAQVNRARAVFVPREDIHCLMDHCPDAQWRLIIALSRYGGLRCPSETLALRWADVDWEHGRMLVRSTKTEHQDGGHARRCPIFPELLPFLREAFEHAEPGSEHVISRYRWKNANLRQSWNASSPRQASHSGPGFSTTCGRRVRLNSLRPSRSPTYAAGLATPRPSLRGTICKQPTPTSRARRRR
jgi:integrase